jgi:hypothetical protein
MGVRMRNLKRKEGRKRKRESKGESKKHKIEKRR